MKTTSRGTKRRRKLKKAMTGDGELAEFGTSLRDSDLAKLVLEQQELELEQRRRADLLKEHTAEREKHAYKGEENAKNDMERLQAVLDFSVTYIRRANQNPPNSQ